MSWIWILATLTLLLGAALWHRVARRLPVLTQEEDPLPARFALLVAEGVHVPPHVVRAADAHAERERLDVLDLIPSDLPVWPALGLLRLWGPGGYRSEPTAAGRSAGHALLVDQDVLSRAGLTVRGPLDVAGLVHAVAELKRCAPWSSDVAVAPGLRALAQPHAGTLAYLMHRSGPAAPYVLCTQLGTYAVLLSGLLLAPIAGAVALATFHLQPLLVFRRLALRPRDLRPQLLLRMLAQILGCVRLLTSHPSAPRALETAERRERREAYRRWLEPGPTHWLSERRTACPLCGSERLDAWIRSPDRLQHKPGEFTLERCGDCGHVFQNPQVSPEGLAFYYADFYDGEGEWLLELIFSMGQDRYHERARAVAGLARPRRWLDVGTGHAHFCLLAREVWPSTRFDGLDVGQSVERAERRGWIHRAHTCLLPELAHRADQQGRYDVVSMHHYLEHTPDPRRELDAAARLLEPGGHLIIEVPDPEWPLGRLLGSWWLPWFQPQHLHFLSVRSLSELLRKRGFEIARVVRGPAHIPCDLLFAVYCAVGTLAPWPGQPWEPPATRAALARWITAWILAAPCAALALCGDLTIAALARRIADRGNAFRIVARRLPT